MGQAKAMEAQDQPKARVSDRDRGNSELRATFAACRLMACDVLGPAWLPGCLPTLT